jgi:hypothetical protein
LLIFWPVRVAHQAVDVDVAEGTLPVKCVGHHDHPRDPEEDDVEAGDQHRTAGTGPARPSCSGQPSVENGTSAGRIPGVEHVLVAGQRAVIAGAWALRLGFAARHEELAVLPYQAGIWWPHQSWRLMHQSWMLFIQWL